MAGRERISSQILSWNQGEAESVASAAITGGQAVIIPTETIYGLTCNAQNSDAVREVYSIKGRELSKPSAVFVANAQEIAKLADVSSAFAQRIIAAFLPGPLTIIAKAKGEPLVGVVGEDGKIGIRVSSHPFVQKLCASTKAPLIATSANFSGQPDCRNDSEVLATFDGIVPVIILGRSTMVGRASTVVDLSGSSPVLVREGTIPFSQLLNCAEERM